MRSFLHIIRRRVNGSEDEKRAEAKFIVINEKDRQASNRELQTYQQSDKFVVSGGKDPSYRD